MQAYANAQRLIQTTPLSRSQSTSDPESVRNAADTAVIEQLLVRLADLVVDRLTARTEASTESAQDDWMDARAAADYLGIHRDTLRKLAAERAVPVHQDGPGCKLYFRRDELDDWRRSSNAPRSYLRSVS
jgi:excisionase family DNA binding protein